MIPENLSLTSPQEDMIDSILSEDNMDDLKDIIKLFNVNMKKRDLIRTSKLSEVQDKVVAQMASRVEDRPDNFSNDDLLKYYKTIQDTIAKSDTSFDKIEPPTIQVNQQINVGDVAGFDRESRKRILDTVNEILKNAQNTTDIIDVDAKIEEN